MVNIQDFFKAVKQTNNEENEKLAILMYILYDAYINELPPDISSRDLIDVLDVHYKRILNTIDFHEENLNENPMDVLRTVRNGAESYAKEFSQEDNPQSGYHNYFMEKIEEFDNLYIYEKQHL